MDLRPQSAALYREQAALEQTLLAAIQNFERETGMRVHSIKIFPGEPKDGRRICQAVEVAAQLR